jgi:hypothetical protein
MSSASEETRNIILREIMMTLLGSTKNTFLLSMIIPPADDTAIVQLEAYMETSSDQYWGILLFVLAWPQTRHVVGWSLLLISKLRSRLATMSDPQQYYTAWLQAADTMTPLLSFELFFPSLREGALELLENLLIGVHLHSPKNFHTCLRPITEVFRLIQAQLQRLRTADLPDASNQDPKAAETTPQLPPFSETIFFLSTNTVRDFLVLSKMYEQFVNADRINGPNNVTLPSIIFDQQVALPLKDAPEHSPYEDLLTATLERMATLLHVKMFQHKGHPELYAPVLKILGSEYVR